MSVLELVSLVRLPADLRSLVVVRAAVAASLAREGWRGESAARVILAAHEATANAIEHGSHPSGVVEIEFSIDGDRATLRVADDGRPGGPALRGSSAAPADPTGERGRGLIIMEAIAERFELRRRDERGTEVWLEFARVP